jgi:excisionase family DNA binding protein
VTRAPPLDGFPSFSGLEYEGVMTTRPADRPLTRADILTSAQVADLLGMKRATVDDWARRKLMPSRTRGKRRFFLRWEVEAWLVAEDG